MSEDDYRIDEKDGKDVNDDCRRAAVVLGMDPARFAEILRRGLTRGGTDPGDDGRDGSSTLFTLAVGTASVMVIDDRIGCLSGLDLDMTPDELYALRRALASLRGDLQEVMRVFNRRIDRIGGSE